MDSSDSDVTKPPPAGSSRDADELRAEREWLLAQEPGEENARASENLKRRGIDFDAAYHAFNNGDHNHVARFLQTVALPPRDMVEVLELRINAAFKRAAVAAAPVNHGSLTVQRPRERHAVSRARARAPSSDDDPEPEPPRLCAGCGEELNGRRKDARTHNAACRQRASRSARADTDRWLADALAIEEKALALVRAGEMTGFDALALVLWPTDRIRAALEEVAA